MSKRKQSEVLIPLSILERPVEENSFALLRFFVEFFGKENAREIINLLTSSKKITDSRHETVQLKIHESLSQRYPILESKSINEIEHILDELYKKADDIISNLIRTSFPGMVFNIGFLDSTATSSTNLSKTISTLLNNGESTSRYKYELLRQVIFALILLDTDNQSPAVKNRRKLGELQSLFEEKIFKGITGEITKQDIFSIHDNKSNSCLATFNSLKEAKELLKEKGVKSKNLHVKQDSWTMRDISDIGLTQTNRRTKSDFSILRKAFFKALLEKKDRQVINMSEEKNTVDSAGFMFVTPIGKRKQILDKVTKELKIKYPELKIVEKHKTDKGRGQSNNVDFLRVLAYINGESKPIEIIIFNQVGHMNYIYELEQAHDLFGLKKSVASANASFIQKIFEYDREEVKEKRKERVEEIKEELLNRNRLPTSLTHPANLPSS